MDEDIMLYKDDLVSAFCRLRYQPDIMAEYDFILIAYLVILIGILFGSRDALYLF